jgi:hypothetical protein
MGGSVNGKQATASNGDVFAFKIMDVSMDG